MKLAYIKPVILITETIGITSILAGSGSGTITTPIDPGAATGPANARGYSGDDGFSDDDLSDDPFSSEDIVSKHRKSLWG